MPPILPEREERGKEIENDPGLNNFDDSKWVFTDISMGIDDSVCNSLISTIMIWYIRNVIL